jgi:hypothetical protein
MLNIRIFKVDEYKYYAIKIVITLLLLFDQYMCNNYVFFYLIVSILIYNIQRVFQTNLFALI